MSRHHRDLLAPSPPRRDHRPLPKPTAAAKAKRLRSKRERDAAKFGPKAPPGGSRRGPRWLQPPPWGGLALGTPLGAPRPVVITQNRLCHRGLFKHEVKSLDVRRLLTPGPAGDGPPAPRIEEGEAGGVPARALKELVAGLASLLGGFGAFVGRDLVSERRRGLVAALRRHRRGPPDLGVLLAHRTPAQPSGHGSTWGEARPGAAGSLGEWDPPVGTPSPPGVGHVPPRAPSPIFGALRERENPFSWSSAEDEEDETPGGLLPRPPPFWRTPQPPQEEEEGEEGGGDEGWTPIAPPVFSPDPPPGGPPPSRDPPGPPPAPKPPQNPFSWSSAEDEEDETPGGLLPRPPPFWRTPQPPQEEEEGEEG
ncbi:proline-rich protein 19-like, partial [Onychostruthus taczanowskii]|uniref:proline-rich protein 19-like n=1 Tax=Onychostruthus taczanowskii TaxID=356909 RepID=UPI001B802A41